MNELEQMFDVALAVIIGVTMATVLFLGLST